MPRRRAAVGARGKQLPAAQIIAAPPPRKPPPTLDDICIELAGHPRGKGRPRRDRLPNGGYVTHTDAKTREFEANLHVAASPAMDGRPPLDGPLWVIIEAAFPIPTSWSGKKRR